MRILVLASVLFLAALPAAASANVHQDRGEPAGLSVHAHAFGQHVAPPVQPTFPDFFCAPGLPA